MVVKIFSRALWISLAGLVFTGCGMELARLASMAA